MHSLVRRHGRFFLHAPTYATPRVSPRSLFDEVSETLAVVRNVALSRVGSVASVGATTSSIAIQNVLIQRLHPSSQEIVKIFFMRCPVKCFECGTFTMSLDLSKDHCLPRLRRGDPSGRMLRLLRCC